MQTLTFIVPFEVPEGQEEVMRQQWHAAAEPLSHATGFLSARLYEIDDKVESLVRQLSGMSWVGKGRFRFVNIAEWASLEHYEAAIHLLRRGRPIAFPSYPTYYHLASDIGKTAEPARLEEPASDQGFTFIVPFEVPEGQEAAIRQQFNDVVKGMGQREGGRIEGSFGPGLYEIDTEAEAHLRNFLSSQLSEGPDAHPAQFRFVNVAGWASFAHYEAVMRSRGQVKPITFTGHGAYYHVAARYIGSDV